MKRALIAALALAVLGLTGFASTEPAGAAGPYDMTGDWAILVTSSNPAAIGTCDGEIIQTGTSLSGASSCPDGTAILFIGTITLATGAFSTSGTFTGGPFLGASFAFYGGLAKDSMSASGSFLIGGFPLGMLDLYKVNTEFALRGDGLGCDTDPATTPGATCIVPKGSEFTVELLLQQFSLPKGPGAGVGGYMAFLAFLDPAPGIAFQQRPPFGEFVSPDCVAGQATFGIGPTQDSDKLVSFCDFFTMSSAGSLYTGPLLSMDFMCNATGSLVLNHGLEDARLEMELDYPGGAAPEGAWVSADSSGDSESLSIICVDSDEFRIAFHSTRDGNPEVYTMRGDGTDPVRLTNNAGPVDGFAAWSPDGSRLAFSSTRDGNHEIYVMNANGSGQTRLTNNAADDNWPAWSPDGTKIAFASLRDGDWEIFTMNAADGSNVQQLTTNAAGDIEPTWSPNGAKLAFLSNRDGNDEIYVMNANGSGQANLTNRPSFQDGSPAWSPNGTKIAFHGQVSGQGYDIIVMNANGTGATPVGSHTANDLHPAWSPDSTRIAFQSDRAGDPEIFVMNANGSGQTQITVSSESEQPAWRRVLDVHPVDSDRDGCSDAKEAGHDERYGGLRDPLYRYDFFDTNGDRAVDLVNDIFAVALAFGLSPANPGYAPELDRSPPSAGMDQWDMGPPDGTINLVTDIFGVAFQFGHNCT